jgi:hypothetical protein
MKITVQSLLAITRLAFAGQATAQVTFYEKFGGTLAHQVGGVSGKQIAGIGGAVGVAALGA